MSDYCVKCIYKSLPSITLNLRENETIFIEGDPINYVYIIQNGLVKVSKIFPSGEERILDILGPGDFLALVSVLKGDEEYIAQATTLNKVELKRLTKADTQKAYKANNQFKDMCLSCAMTRTNLFQSQLFNSTNYDTEDKILNVLIYLSKKFGSIENGRHIINLPFSKTTLANIIGIRRETLSRKLSKMQDENVLSIEKNKYIFDRM